MSSYFRPPLTPAARLLGFRDSLDDLQFNPTFLELVAQAEAQETLGLLQSVYGPAITDSENKSAVTTTTNPTNWLKNAMNAPAVDVKETETEFQVIADMPGVDVKDVQVSITRNASGEKQLNLSGKRTSTTQSAGGKKTVQETTTYNRVLLLPTDAIHSSDRMDAVMDKGVLTVTIPKAKPGMIQTHDQLVNEIKLRNTMNFEHLKYVPTGAPHSSQTPSALALAKMQMAAAAAGSHQDQFLHHVYGNFGHPTSLQAAQVQLQASAAGAHQEEYLRPVPPRQTAVGAEALNRGLLEWQMQNRIKGLSALNASLSSMLPHHVEAGSADAGTNALDRARIQIAVRQAQGTEPAANGKK